MFTGIVQALGTIESAAETGAGKRFVVQLGALAAVQQQIAHGDSVCVSGVCLTAVKVANGAAHFDVITETLRRSTLGRKKVRDAVNLELSLRGDSFVGGHFVQGHVDAVARVVSVREDVSDWRITFGVPAEVMPYMVPKGSVAVDGVSMTIAEVGANTFTLAVIPTTLEKTTLAGLRAGDQINVETDILARTVVNYLKLMQGAAGAPVAEGAAITLAKLQELGMA